MPTKKSRIRRALSRAKPPATGKIVVMVTCESKEQAEKIGRAVVEQRLAACANILDSPVRSIYRWRDKVESGKETLMILKSSGAKFPSLQRELQRLHSYEVPEIIALPIVAGSKNYLSWMAGSLSTRSSSGEKS